MVTKRVSETRERILQAASEAVLHSGAGGLRVDSVAQAANANKRMIYHYFGDKEGLIRAVHGSYAQKLNASTSRLSDDSRRIFTQLLAEFGAPLESETTASAAELSDAMQVLLPILMRNEGVIAPVLDISPAQWRTFSTDVMNMMFVALSSKADSTKQNKPRYRMASTSRLR